MNTSLSDFSDTDPAPEVPAGTEQLQVWDDPPAAFGREYKAILPDDDSDATSLVEEGVEEADRELRVEDEAEAEPEDESGTPTDDTAPPTDGILS